MNESSKPVKIVVIGRSVTPSLPPISSLAVDSKIANPKLESPNLKLQCYVDEPRNRKERRDARKARRKSTK